MSAAQIKLIFLAFEITCYTYVEVNLSGDYEANQNCKGNRAVNLLKVEKMVLVEIFFCSDDYLNIMSKIPDFTNSDN